MCIIKGLKDFGGISLLDVYIYIIHFLTTLKSWVYLFHVMKLTYFAYISFSYLVSTNICQFGKKVGTAIHLEQRNITHQRGYCNIQGNNTSVANEFWNSEEEISQYGIDWEGPIPSIESNSVTVPDGSFNLNEEQLRNIQENFDVFKESSSMGVDLYVELKSMVSMFNS